MVLPARQVILTSPAFGATISEFTPTFAGRGEPGASIQVTGNSGKVLATATVDAQGAWSARSNTTLWEGRFLGAVYQDAAGELSQTGFDYTIQR